MGMTETPAPAPAPKPRYTSRDLREALARRHKAPEWAIFYEVSASTGQQIRRYADAVAMSLWPSRGFQIHGYEIKVSRSDLKAELEDPHKADDVGKFCDHWWIAAPAGLCTPAELPETWGLLELNGNGLRTAKPAPRRAPTDVDRGFAAAMIRRAYDMQQAHISAAIDRGNAQRQAEAAAGVARETQRIRQEMEKLRDWAANFETAFGQKVTTYFPPEDFAARIRLAEKIGSQYGPLAIIEREARNLAKLIGELDITDAEPGPLLG